MLPQLDYTTYLSQVFWLMANFSILYFFLSFFAIPKVDKIMNQRSKLLEENKLKTQRNRDLCHDENEKYQIALNNANSLASDILHDSDLIMEHKKNEMKSQMVNIIEKLNKENDIMFSKLKNGIIKELVDETINIVSMYQQNMTQSRPDQGDLDKLRKDIEKEYHD